MQLAKRNDRKRKQRGSSSIMEGLFTRSKSQIYLHCNRSGRFRADSTRSKPYHHQLQQLDPPVKKSKRPVVENLEGSLDICEMPRTSIKDLRARRVFSPASVVFENDEILKKSENAEEVENEGIGKIGTDNNGTVSISKSNSTVSSSLRRKVFIAPSSFSYRRMLPYMKAAVTKHFDVSEIEMDDTVSKSNYATLSYLKPDLRSVVSNCSTSVDEHVHANSDVSKPLECFEVQKIELNVSSEPKDHNDVPDVFSQTRLESRVFTDGGGLDPEALEKCVQTTPPNSDIFGEADVSELGASIERSDQQTGKNLAGLPSDRINEDVRKKSCLSPGRNSNASRNKLALNPCSRLKVFKPANSVSYRRLLPFLMDAATNNSGGASNENGHPKFLRDLEGNQPLMSMSKEVPMNKEYSPKKDEIEEQVTKLLEPKCISTNDLTNHLNTCLSSEVLSSAADSFNKQPRSVFPYTANSQTLLNVIKSKSETESIITSNTEKSEPERLCNEITNLNTGENCSGVPSSSNVRAETSPGEFKVDTVNLVPINLEDLLSEYMVEDPKVEPISPEGDRMTLEVDCHDENRNLIEVIGSNCSELTSTIRIHTDASEALKKELFLKPSDPEPINNENSCKVLLANSNEDSGGLEAVSLVKESSSAEPSDFSGYGNDGPSKTLSMVSIQGVSQDESTGSPRDYTSVSNNRNTNGCLEPANRHQKSTCDESSDELITSPGVLTKGILKRNPRGCRGLCNCLNCASFRLHAERAFEFSRNQMQDTEEVVLGLMKELADMRVFLEKHLPSENGLAPIPLTQLEVDEACTKALEAEQLAKERLSQMSNELNYHCRITALYRPRVTFASNTEEKAVAMIESSSSKPEKEEAKAKTKRNKKKHP